MGRLAVSLTFLVAITRRVQVGDGGREVSWPSTRDRHLECASRASFHRGAALHKLLGDPSQDYFADGVARSSRPTCRASATAS